jgi:hypothetical protein
MNADADNNDETFHQPEVPIQSFNQNPSQTFFNPPDQFC